MFGTGRRSGGGGDRTRRLRRRSAERKQQKSSSVGVGRKNLHVKNPLGEPQTAKRSALVVGYLVVPEPLSTAPSEQSGWGGEGK